MKNAESFFISYIQGFMAEKKLFPKNGKAYLGVSGGVDSMVLLYVLSLLYRRGYFTDLVAVMVDHGTRSNINNEVELVSSYCKKLGVKFELKSVKLSLDMPNFEMLARTARYNIFTEISGKDSRFYLAHHIDDAFEWSLLHQFKSGVPGLGIPLKRGSFARPFFCMTKSNIKKMASELSIPFLDDESNENIRFERNFLRKEITPQIKKRFPSYLKHFVIRTNRMAKREGKFRGDHFQSDYEVKSHSKNWTYLLLRVGEDFSDAEEEIVTIIEKLSSKSRGSLSLEVQKLISAHKRSRKGPMSFSGGVKCLISSNGLFFFNTQFLTNLSMPKSWKKAGNEDLLSHPFLLLKWENLSHLKKPFCYDIFSNDENNTGVIVSPLQVLTLLQRSKKNEAKKVLEEIYIPL